MVRAGYPESEWLTNTPFSLTILPVRNTMELNWFEFSGGTGYITDAEHQQLTAECAEIGRMLGSMIKSPDKFLTSDF